jgi:hypothetical protein
MPCSAAKSMHVALGVLGDRKQRLRPLQPDLFFLLLRPGPLAGAHLAAIAPGCAVAEFRLLDQHDIDAGLRQIGRRRQAGEAAADDRHVAAPVAVERRIVRPLSGRRLVPGISRRDRTLIGHGLVFKR